MIGRRLLFCAALLVTMAAAGEVRACQFPLHHCTTDPSPAELIMRNENDPDPSRREVLIVPKAFLEFLSGYPPRAFRSIPDRIETSSASLAFTYPDGKALTVHATEIAERDGISFAAARESLRELEYTVLLGYVRPGIPWESRVRGVPGRSFVGNFGGLAHFRAYHRDVYLGEDGRDEFVEVRCMPHNESRPGYFCETVLRVGGDLSAYASFVDFRFHGGRDFLN